ncbi:C39 family peptidase [Serratia aquatilis]|uniref:C39 family peptidase n=1 Tax=Serratia aquatilis TaxID=1737515 RepID=A0ABV6EE00_9GAMM
MAQSTVPYFCQWATPELAVDLIKGRAALADDANWAESGAADQAEYCEWANHVCGMACLKMVLAHRDGTAPPLLELARRSLPYGAYVREGKQIKGLIYAPFVEFVGEQFSLTASVQIDVSVDELPQLLTQYRYFMASVHPSIRQPQTPPPTRGGHLVLLIAADKDTVTFHNPSGDSRETRQHVTIKLNEFGRFFAGRGIAIR